MQAGRQQRSATASMGMRGLCRSLQPEGVPGLEGALLHAHARQSALQLCGALLALHQLRLLPLPKLALRPPARTHALDENADTLDPPYVDGSKAGRFYTLVFVA